MPETTLAQRIETLTALTPGMSGRDLAFADSLIMQYRRRGGLSPRQEPYVQQLIDRAQNPEARPTVEVGSLQRVIELLEHAARHLRHPAVLMLANGRTLRLSIAGPRSRQPGTVNVAGTGNFADRDWYGRVTRDGQFEPCRRYDQETQQSVAAALQALATDPAAAAAAYGHLTGVCCFCGRPLTDERSTGVGYGSTCADHYGLPWGARAAAAVREGAPAPRPARRRTISQDIQAGRIHPGTLEPMAREVSETGRLSQPGRRTVLQQIAAGRALRDVLPTRPEAEEEGEGWW